MLRKKQMPRRIDAPIYSYWQALYMAFYSRQLYVDVAKRWKGIGFFYVWLMIAVTSIPLSVRFISEFNHFINEQIVEPLKTIPPLELQRGEIVVNKPMPYLVRSKTGAVVAMIDTRTNGEGMTDAYPELMMLITKNKFYFRQPTIHLFASARDNSKGHKPIVQMPDPNISRLLVFSEWLESSGILKLKWPMAAVIYFFTVSFLFGLFFSLFLILAMLAQVFSWFILRFKITFTQTVRVLVVASTVQLAVLSVFMSINRVFPSLGLLCVVLCALYFSFAVLSVKRDSLRMVRS